MDINNKGSEVLCEKIFRQRQDSIGQNLWIESRLYFIPAFRKW
jgi:hypothetical protein